MGARQAAQRSGAGGLLVILRKTAQVLRRLPRAMVQEQREPMAKRPISRHTHPQHPQVQLSTLVGSGVGWLVGCKGDSEQTSIALGRTLASLGLSVFLRRMGETCCSDRYVPCEWWQACG